MARIDREKERKHFEGMSTDTLESQVEDLRIAHQQEVAKASNISSGAIQAYDMYELAHNVLATRTGGRCL